MFNNFASNNPLTLIPLVAITGFLDGIHPCAIAILIFFIAFLITLQKSFKNIFAVGLLYIFIIFLTYLAVGVGLFSGVVILGQPHFFARLGSWLLIFLGLIHIKDAFFPQLPPHFRMPSFASGRAKELLAKTTLPSIALAAFLVGLCSIPCAGGIYVAITSLLASKTTYFTGLSYLILYNIMFVLPLLILLVFAANPLTLAKIAELKEKNEKAEKLVMGTMLLALGVFIFKFLI
ncbi:MAG: cytochrome c biogenesis protein CcdA [bacterium]|nr:cytochrome c biogenesis protein CcdA [bacterium]